MYSIMGITGQVGGATARALLDQGHAVRAIVRNPEKADAWRQRGADIAVADFLDATALAEALQGTEGAFVMIPPNFAPSPDHRETRASIAALASALTLARPPRVAVLSSIGAEQDHGLGLITSLHMLEAALAPLGIPVAFLRAGWFMENFAGDLQAARYTGEIESNLQPASLQIPMVATADVGRTAARILSESWTGERILEIAGPEDYTPQDAADAFTKALGHPIYLKLIPRDAWAGQFVAQGTPEDRTALRIEMLDGFNARYIHFGVPGTESVRGTVTLEELIRSLVARP